MDAPVRGEATHYQTAELSIEVVPPASSELEYLSFFGRYDDVNGGCFETTYSWSADWIGTLDPDLPDDASPSGYLFEFDEWYEERTERWSDEDCSWSSDWTSWAEYKEAAVTVGTALVEVESLTPMVSESWAA